MQNTNNILLEKSGMDALGYPVPERRIDASFKLLKDDFGLDSLSAMSVIKTAVQAIEDDMPIKIIGASNHYADTLTSDLQKIDVTGRYRLFATLLTA